MISVYQISKIATAKSQLKYPRDNIQKTTKKDNKAGSPRSTVAAKGEGVVSLPGSPAGRPCLVVSVSLSTQTPVLLAGRSESTKLPVLVYRLAEPVDSRVIANSIVGNIDENHLKVLVS